MEGRAGKEDRKGGGGEVRAQHKQKNQLESKSDIYFHLTKRVKWGKMDEEGKTLSVGRVNGRRDQIELTLHG